MNSEKAGSDTLGLTLTESRRRYKVGDNGTIAARKTLVPGAAVFALGLRNSTATIGARPSLSVSEPDRTTEIEGPPKEPVVDAGFVDLWQFMRGGI